MPTSAPYCNPSGYSAECIAAAGTSAGFGRDRATLERVVAVALAESGGKVAAVNRNSNGSTDVGLMQINSIHGYKESEMKFPAANMAAAWKISNEGRNWTPWVVFKTGAYLLYMPAAKLGVQKIVTKGYKFGTVTQLLNDGSNSNNPLVPDAIEDPYDAAQGTAESIANLASFPGKILAWISDRNNIIRLAKAGIGVAIVIVGIGIVARPLTKPVVDTATKIAGVAGPGKVAKVVK